MVRRARQQAPRQQRGLSLVELMVALAIAMLLAMVGTALNTAWADQSAVRQSDALLRQAMGELKALALRNAEGRPMGDAAAVLLHQPGRLCVHSGNPAAASCEGARWQASPRASIQLAEQDEGCLAMDSSGRVIDAQIGATACGSALDYRIQRNKESFDGSLD
jgi:prepilin-type N-terminal cleavage/methylation domain-containing protein